MDARLQYIPLLSAGPREILAAVPYDLAMGSREIRILRRTQATAGYATEIAPAFPGVFTMDRSGTGPAAAINQDGTPNGPDNPAARGSVVSLYATGLGPVTSTMQPMEHFDVYISSATKLEILWAGGAPTLPIGVFQVNVRIPVDSPRPRMLVKFAFDPPQWDRSQDGVFVYVQ